MLGQRRPRREERGASAVEFALVVPILVIIVFGIVNIGAVLAQQISINNSVRQAARYAVVDGHTCANIQTEVKAGAATIGMTAASIPDAVIAPACTATTAKPCTGTADGTNVAITLTRKADWVIVFPPLFANSTEPTLTSTGVMRCEFN